jgi:hypothetical protein
MSTNAHEGEGIAQAQRLGSFQLSTFCFSSKIFKGFQTAALAKSLVYL